MKGRLRPGDRSGCWVVAKRLLLVEEEMVVAAEMVLLVEMGETVMTGRVEGVDPPMPPAVRLGPRP